MKKSNEFTVIMPTQEKKPIQFINDRIEGKLKNYINNYKKTLVNLNEFDLGGAKETKEAYCGCQEFMAYYRVLDLEFDNYYRKAYNIGLTAFARYLGKEKSEVSESFRKLLADDTEWARKEFLIR